MKVSKKDLQQIFNLAHNYFMELSPAQGELDSQEFRAKCYLLACSSFLKIETQLEFPERIVFEPPEE